MARRRLVSRGDLPGSNGGIYNPGALLEGDRILLLCRREIDYEFRSAQVFPELLTFDRRTLELVDYRTLAKVGYPLDTRIEDFRCIAFGGERLVVHSTVRPDRIKPAISRMYDDALARDDDFFLPVPKARVEKNWVLFEHHGALHCLYKLDPLTIFVRGDDRQWRLVKEEENGWAQQIERGLSNSANLIPFEGGFLGFWHTIAAGRYLQGAFLLDESLSIRFRTPPLLDGADIDDGFKPGVIYVSSLVDDGRQVMAFYGEGDAHTGVAIFDRRELFEELQRWPFAPIETLRVRLDVASLSDAVRGMQELRQFSERHHHPRIRLFVEHQALRRLVESLALPNVVVQAQSPGIDAHCTLARDGTLRWNDSRGENVVWPEAGIASPTP